MLKYFISLVFLSFFVTYNAFAQDLKKNNTTQILKDSVSVNYHPKTYGLRIGTDILNPIVSTIRTNFKALQLVADYRLSTRVFIASELGYANRTLQEDKFNHTVKGTYLKAGINYNLYSNWLDMDNEIYIGFRYGFSLFSNELNNYTVFQKGGVFEPKQVNSNTKFQNLNTHWLEFVVGVKVEVLKNLYVGFMININKLIASKNPNNFKNTYTPGFGKITKNGSGANMNYSISYRIPLYKK